MGESVHVLSFRLDIHAYLGRMSEAKSWFSLTHTTHKGGIYGARNFPSLGREVKNGV